MTTATGEEYRGRRLVLGVGTSPWVPECRARHRRIHSAEYLNHKERLQSLDSITVVGSGQSAAEIYQDLLAESPDHDYELTWLTRSPRFFPMEYTKLTLEMTSPEYAAYFHDLPDLTRARLLREQRSLYKGISGDLVDDIFDLHYRLARERRRAAHDAGHQHRPSPAPAATAPAYELDLRHEETGERVRPTHRGRWCWRPATARRCRTFLDPVRDRIAWDDHGRYAVAPTYTVDHGGREIFVQNAEEHTHGLVAPDLGMGAYRNSVIIAAMLGREVYAVEKRIAVQSFGVPDHLKEVAR